MSAAEYVVDGALLNSRGCSTQGTLCNSVPEHQVIHARMQEVMQPLVSATE